MNLKIGDETIELNKEHLAFNESTINEYLQKEASFYAYYQECLVKATHILGVHEDLLDKLSSEKFVSNKSRGSDKFVEAIVSCDDDVVELTKKIRVLRRNKEMVQMFLRAFDKAHDNALNLCYNIRKEMDKIFPNIKDKEDWESIDRQAREIVRKNSSSSE